MGGFYSGEGCIYYGEQLSKKQRALGFTNRSIRIQVSQADGSPESLERVKRAMNSGLVLGPYTSKGRKENPNWKPIYLFTLCGFEGVQAFIAAIWPWMTKRKQEQAKAVLRGYIDFYLEKFGPGPRKRTRYISLEDRRAGNY
mgnify:CR=1 FL=1